MDDQALKLRQLVREFRRSTLVAMGLPRFAVVAANDRAPAERVATVLEHAAQRRGVGVATNPEDLAADWLLVLARGDDAETAQAWRQSSAVLLVTTADNEAILAGYTLLKRAAQSAPIPAVELIVCTDSESEVTQELCERFRTTCQRFLNCSVVDCTLLSAAVDDRVDDMVALDRLIDRLLLLAPIGAAAATPLAPQIEMAV